MYNHLRRHIVKLGEYFYVRKFSLKYMSYLYLDARHWWLSGNMNHETFYTLEEARARVNETYGNFVTYI